MLTGALGLGIGGVAAATAIALFLSWICSIFYIRRRCTELALPVLPCGFDAGAGAKLRTFSQTPTFTRLFFDFS